MFDVPRSDLLTQQRENLADYYFLEELKVKSCRFLYHYQDPREYICFSLLC